MNIELRHILSLPWVHLYEWVMNAKDLNTFLLFYYFLYKLCNLGGEITFIIWNYWVWNYQFNYCKSQVAWKQCHTGEWCTTWENIWIGEWCAWVVNVHNDGGDGLWTRSSKSGSVQLHQCWMYVTGRLLHQRMFQRSRFKYYTKKLSS